MNKMKIITVVGTRPEIIRLSRVLAHLNENINNILIHTGQNYDYELNEIFFLDLSIKKPKYFLNAAEKTASQTIGKIIFEFDKILEKEKPDAILILGDTNSSLAALPAKKRKIPIFHMEAGNRCFDMRVPEEVNRRIVDHISDINLTYSSLARENLIREGLHSHQVIKVGSPMKEVLKFYEKKINSSKILSKLKLKRNEYYLISCHREENIEDEFNFHKFVSLIKSMSNKLTNKIIISTHPRTKKRISKSKIKFSKKIKFLKPLSFSDYNHLQNNAITTLSDSGTISEESSISNFPALNIRETHERPEAMEEASVMMVGLDEKRVFQALNILKKQRQSISRVLNPVRDYEDINISEKILRIIISYVDYVNRTVWKK